jgi:hypothetical protein
MADIAVRGRVWKLELEQCNNNLYCSFDIYDSKIENAVFKCNITDNEITRSAINMFISNTVPSEGVFVEVRGSFDSMFVCVDVFTVLPRDPKQEAENDE